MQSLNKGSDVVYDTWRKHPEWPRLHLTDFMHNNRYFRAEHECADCAYNSWPNRTGVRSHMHMLYISTYIPTVILQFTDILVCSLV
jgi:hypothetical protein